MTQKAQDIDDLKGQKVQDIDDPVHVFSNLIPSVKKMIKGVSNGARTQENSY